VKVFGQHDQKTLDQIRDVGQRAVRTALMADGHVGYVMPIGGVAAYDNQVSVVGVGFDIACGNAAILTDAGVGDLGPTPEAQADALRRIADDLQRTLSFGVGRHNRCGDAPTDDPLFADAAWDAVPRQHRQGLRGKARAQLGTVGSGNHYVDLFADEQHRLWVGVHFGSRGFGHTVASAFLALGQGQKWGARVPEREVLLDLGSHLGESYWALMTLAGRYAYAGREWVARKVVQMLGAAERDLVHNHHNFAWRERHDGRDVIVVRKGATPAFPGQRGFVGGSMGDDAVIVQGASAKPGSGTAETQRHALYSTVHGAGRVMSRTQAAGPRYGPQRGRGGAITPAMMREWVSARGVILRGGGLDESPHVYRRLPQVLAAQGSTIDILHTLRPLVVVMAKADEYDPYKD
jgi:tRNA-splicing ligase RtcB (3'-phosphate/5'-hydroxy nucleic acid ligase)